MLLDKTKTFLYKTTNISSAICILICQALVSATCRPKCLLTDYQVKTDRTPVQKNPKYLHF
uniref:Uncharacterized protein n=1 Tax=Ciona intestinalis TaxID=7719 RepID=H2XVT0_CIOIN